MSRPILLVGIFALAGCAAISSQPPPEEGDFGHRIEGETEGRQTIVITPVSNADDYDVSSAPFESIDVRIGDQDTDGAAVELLIKGSLPDACSELHGVNQTQTGDEIVVQLQSRRPTGALCATVLRPYRFYLGLEGTFAPGRYTLDLNGRRQQFSVE